MTQAPRDRNSTELESLYQRAGDVEPDAGIDRTIRARAEQATHRASRSRAPWIGGLVTASVAVVAIAVVLQQPPPSPEMPRSPSPHPPSAPEATEPSMQALERERTEAGTATASRLAEPAADRAGTAEDDAAPETARKPTPDRRQEARDSAGFADREPTVSKTAEEIASTPVENPGQLLAVIRDRLEADRIDEARALLERLRVQHPAFDVPEDIMEALSPPPEPGG